MKKVSLSVISLLIIGVLAACGSEPKVADFPDTADPQAELDRLDSGIANARDQQVNVLSPENFVKAVEYRKDAVEARADNKAQKKILHKIAVADAFLDKAVSTAGVSRLLLPDVVDARKDAIEAKAYMYYPKEMRAIDNRLVDITSQVEKNGTSKLAGKKDKITGDYRNYELQSIKNFQLAKARSDMNEALKEGAQKLTPDTLGWARTKIATNTALIESHPHDNQVVTGAAAEATAAGERLLKMVRTAKVAKEAKPESVAKQIESKELEAQSAEQDQSATANELAHSQMALDQAAAQKSDLESKVWLDKEFDKANSQFTKNEAEVYKQGDKLLLRLKGLTFPTSQAVITAQNYPLLAKVQAILKDVEPSDVTVEGHTDSTGSKKVNESLSQKRAEAVQSYLVSNSSVPNDKISAKGYGFSKPIATNKTAEGRAQNRRVDIIITPQSTAVEDGQTKGSDL